MCHRYRQNATPEELAREFSVASVPLELPDAKDRFPLLEVAVVRASEEDERELACLEWGLLPAWWKASAKSKSRNAFQRKCFNAKCETVHEKPSYREAFKRRRCLVVATAFFEKGHWFHLADQHSFAFAGIWERWQGISNTGEKEIVESCTVITTEANELVRSVGHHRMPVLLTDEEPYALWLGADIAERGQLEHLFRPYGPELICTRDSHHA